MTLNDCMKKLDLKVIVDAGTLDRDITSCYVSDLLSNVMGQCKEGSLWVTMQGHQNIVAVASLVGMTGIIVVGGAAIEDEAVTKAKDNDVTILSTKESSFDVAGMLYELGLRGI